MSPPPPAVLRSGGAESAFTILVSLQGDASLALATVSSIVERAAYPNRLRVVGSQANVNHIRHRFDRLEVETDESASEIDDADLLRTTFAREPELDVLFVRPGILVPPLFDLRLRWSAYSHENVGSVFPLCDVEPLTSLHRYSVRAVDHIELDRLVASTRPPMVVDAPFVLPECFYVRSDQASFLGSLSGPLDLLRLVHELNRRGVLTALSPHVYVGATEVRRRAEPIVAGEAARVFLAESPVYHVAAACSAGRQTGPALPSIEAISRPRVLLVMHSLGGGLELWSDLYSNAADAQETFILKSIGERGRFGSQLWLYDSHHSKRPIWTWKLATPIAHTAISHVEYSRIIREIVTEYGIEAVVVGSLIGHSLDVFRSGRRTAFVCHDYYPFCPAIHIHYGAVCTSCTQERLAGCVSNNPLYEIFESRDDLLWATVRRAFIDALLHESVSLIAPSESVCRHYRQLAPELDAVSFTVIPHGDVLGSQAPVPPPEEDASQPLRVVVLGRLSYAKGGELVRELVEKSRSFAEFTLVGAGAGGERFGPGVTVIRDYDGPHLPELLRSIRPDLALLVSIVPETFSFTLGECFEMALPALATRVGSFEDRITDRLTGFLCEPTVDAVFRQLQELHRDRSPLRFVHANLLRRSRRTARDMAQDYASLLALPDWSERAYCSRLGRPGRQPDSQDPGDQRHDGFHLSPSSPLGLLDFLKQVEEGIDHHLRHTKRLRPWQRMVMTVGSHAFFRLTRIADRIL